MGWDSADGGWVPPKERAAAQKAAERFERERAASDYRTEQLCRAITGGFGVLADAIMLAAGVEQGRRDEFFTGAADDNPPDYRPGIDDIKLPLNDRGQVTMFDNDDDPEMDDLLDK